MVDICTRLRAIAGQYAGLEDLYEAADLIEKLELSLKPFASFANAWDKKPLNGMDDVFYSIHGGSVSGGAELTLTDCRNARSALDTLEFKK